LKLRHKLAVSQECSQPLLGRHPPDILCQATARGLGQLRFHAAM
jgi:hypothetical protein